MSFYTFTRKNKRTGKRQYVATPVDDILVISPSVRERKQLERELEESFALSPQVGSKISYLGLNIVHNKDKGFIKISQEGMIKDLVKKYNMDKLKKYPTNPTSSSTFLTIKKKDNPKLPDNKEYLSIIMSLMFIARYTRPDILMPVSYLATKNNAPTKDDMDKAKRILKFLAGTTTKGIASTDLHLINLNQSFMLMHLTFSTSMDMVKQVSSPHLEVGQYSVAVLS
jgi:hypothetical protein